MKLAVVGSGVAGLGCAHVLGTHHDVTLFEAEHRLGGHAQTVTVEDPETGPLAIDVGFIVHNDRTYPNLMRLFDDLAVPVQDTEMSFAVTDREFGGGGAMFTYRATNPRTLFADPRNLVRRPMWQMLADIIRFQRDANRLVDELEGGEVNSLTLDRFLSEHKYSETFVDHHLIPLGAAVWSANPDTFGAFPAVALFRFLRNHGLLGLGNRPQWRTIVGGSRVYVDAIVRRFTGTIRLNTPVIGVRREDNGVVIRTGTGTTTEHFDRVILACHSDQALRMLDDASVAEKDVLGAISYQPNTATLHTDTSVLSPRRRAWAAWNYECAPDGREDARATLTYDLTALQRLDGSRRYLVSLNSAESIRQSAVLATFNYSHPVFDTAAMQAQGRFHEIDGVNATHFCGAYWGYGFHEDGFVSALRVARQLGVRW